MYTHPGNRPRFLSLMAIKFPLNAKISAMHRITGLMLIVSLLGYLALAHLIIIHPAVSLTSVHDHCIVNCLNSIFWSAPTFHWLSGLRHLLVEHFTKTNNYQLINNSKVSYLLLITWLIMSIAIIYQAWY